MVDPSFWKFLNFNETDGSLIYKDGALSQEVFIQNLLTFFYSLFTVE